MGSALAAEYEAPAVKAAFLHRFASYVEWPNFPSEPTAPFTIAVLDDNAVAEHLQRLVPGLSLHNRRAQVVSVTTIAEGRNAQILYIGPAQAPRARAMIATLKGQPVLVVTGHDRGLSDGAAINFVQVGRNVRFEVSLPAARNNGLQINAGLLSVAVRVVEDPRADQRPGAWPTFSPVADNLVAFARSLPSWANN